MKKHLHKATKFHASTAFIIIAIIFAVLFIAANIVISQKNHVTPLTGVLGLSANNNYYNLQVTHIAVATADSSAASKRATVTTSLTNNGSQILQVSPGLQMFLVTDTGSIYNMTAKYLAPGTALGGPLAINGSMTINVDFDIPFNETPKTFTYQPDSSKPTAKIGL